MPGERKTTNGAEEFDAQQRDADLKSVRHAVAILVEQVVVGEFAAELVVHGTCDDGKAAVAGVMHLGKILCGALP